MAYDILELEIVFDELKEKSDKTIQSFKSELSNMRAGRANAHILDKVTVDYYGTPTPINQMANISVPEARMIVISVWDASQMKAVEKAIVDANLGIMPNNDGKVIRLVFPELTEERRRALAKDVKAAAEKTKVAVRNVRRDGIEDLRKLKKDNVISEDLLADTEKEVDKIVSAKIESIEKLQQEKETEIMSV